jgi:hypothetical protein
MKSMLAFTMLMAVAWPAFGQVETRWKAPDNVIRPDFGPQNTKRRVRFLDDGLAWEVPVEFLMIRHGRIALVADLPEDGQFQVVQANAAALVDVRNVRTKGNQGKADVVARVAALGRTGVTAQARRLVADFWNPVEKKVRERAGKRDRRQLDQYVFDRTLRQLLPEIRRRLNDLAGRRPDWVSEQEQDAWQTAEDRALLDAYVELLEWEIMDAHLKRCGVELETGIRSFQNKLESWFDAVYAVTSGKVEDDPEAARRVYQVLGLREVNRLREALSVRLQCRFYPRVDPEDPNARWFNAQRVACRAQGVLSIRIEGQLDPQNHDRVDWWIVEGYSPTGVTLHVDKKAGYRVDPPFLSPEGARLRVVATGGQPVRYAMEFRPIINRRRSDRRVLICESPAPAESKFPF